MLADVLHLLCCPICRGPLERQDAVLACQAGHSYDIARQGYVNLLPGGAAPRTADDQAMVRARTAFLAAGHYDPLSAALASAVPGGPVIDVGAGTGHHLARVLDRLSTVGLAIDLSKYAVRAAAHAHPRIGAVVADAWQQLPVRDGVAGAVLSVFAPRGADEAARVLAPGGCLVVVVPTDRHLRELVTRYGLITVDPAKDERLARQLAGFRLASRERVEQRLALSAEDVRAAVGMGPSARHVDPATAYRAGEVTLSVTVGRYYTAQPPR